MRHGETASVAFLAFDVLWLNGTDYRKHPYEQRREALEGLDLPEPVYVSPRFDDEALFEQTRAQGRASSPNVGRRSTVAVSAAGPGSR